VKVKRLSPDVAVVHARMALSGETPRATIVTFVVHRLGERWLCASVHNTDVMPDVAANVTNVSREPGVFRSATEQTGGVS
jgi:hypothetical protein